jgi:hypothetical protein
MMIRRNMHLHKRKKRTLPNGIYKKLTGESMEKIAELINSARSFNIWGISGGSIAAMILLCLALACPAQAQDEYPTVVSFNADRNLVYEGENATLVWVVANSTNITIKPDIGAVGLNGSVEITPKENSTYFLNATDGENSSTATVTINVIKKPPEVLYFKGDKIKIKRGENLTLYWNVSNANDVFVTPEPGRVELNDSSVVTPRDTTTYSILATNAGGAAAGPAVPQITVDVSPILYEFIPNANRASWYYWDGKYSNPLDFNGADTDKRGSARWIEELVLSNGSSISQKVLWTHPSWVDDGWIMGIYDLGDYVVQEDDHISGAVSLKKDATWGNVIFYVILIPEGKDPSIVSEVPVGYSDGTKTFDVYLNNYAGKKGKIALEAYANGGSSQDWAVWLDLKLIRG